LLSKYNKLVKNVNDSFLEYDLNKVVRFLTSFVSEDLSNWYIRRNRNRFWGNKLNDSKKSVYITTYEVLVGLSKLMAPITPFLSEELYRNLTNLESVHLAFYPECEEALINEEIETKMDMVRDLISIGRCVREENKIKVRQPLSEAIIDGKNESLLKDLVSLIMEELNVKKVTFAADLGEYMNYNIKPNFKVVGKILGSKIKEFTSALDNLSEFDKDKLINNEDIIISLSNEEFTVTKEMIDIRIVSKEGFNVGMENNDFIILNTELSDDLILEGIARELVSKIQNMRKNNDYNVSDRINIKYNGDDLVNSAIDKFMDYLKTETLAINITKDDSVINSLDLNGHVANILIEKV